MQGFPLPLMLGDTPKRNALDCFMVPQADIVEFYELHDAYQIADRESSPRKKWDFWAWIYSKWPMFREAELELDLSHILMPMLNTTGTLKLPKVGRRYAEVHPLPAAQIYPFLEKVGIDNASPCMMQRYELWQWIAQHVPQVRDGGDWDFAMVPGIGVWITKSHEDDEEEDD